MINFATLNALRIINSFFCHKEIHNFTWTNRGYRSITDYILANSVQNSMTPESTIAISSDHFAVLSRINIPTRWITNKRPSVNKRKEYFTIHLLCEDSVRKLYCQRLNQG
jgi:hypothetical protein